MKFEVKNIKWIIIGMIAIILSGGIGVYAGTEYFASDISYKKPGTNTEISVETALNDLYSKSNKTPQQVGTFTNKGEVYTFQNDGYIVGTVYSTSVSGAVVYIGGLNDAESTDKEVYCTTNSTATVCSIFCTAGTTVHTRKNVNGPIYNLTIYEFK